MTRTKLKKNKLQLVVIEWGDAWVRAPWTDKSSARAGAQPAIVYTVGWMISKDSGGVLVSSQIAGSDQLANQSFIPRKMIRGVTIIKSGELEHE